MRRALTSVLHLFTLFSFASAAAFFFSLPFLPELRVRLVHSLVDDPSSCFWVGGAFALTSLLLLIGFYLVNRGRTLRIRMGGNFASVEIPAIRKTLEEYLRRAMPNQITLVDLQVIRGKKLQIGVVMPNREEKILAEVEKSIGSLLKERFGYLHSFDLILHSTF